MTSYPQEFSQVFSRLTGLQYNGRDRWVAKCPAHEDNKPSLSVAIGNGKLLVKCHARGHKCGFPSIVSSLGLQVSDFFQREGSMSSNKFVCSYDYRDENNKLLFQVCRLEPKAFYQRRPNPTFNPAKPANKDTNPEYINNLEGVRRVIFALPHVIQSLREHPTRYVLIVEGEKDASLLNKNGMVATCNPMGALEWHPKYSVALKGCNVVVIPDNDPVDAKLGYSAGYEHAHRVCRSLEGVAKQILFLELPGVGPKGDISDWWNQDAFKNKSAADRKAELGKLIKCAKTWSEYKQARGLKDPEPEVAAPLAVDVPEVVEKPATASAADNAINKPQDISSADAKPESCEAPRVCHEAKGSLAGEESSTRLAVEEMAKLVPISGRFLALGHFEFLVNAAKAAIVAQAVDPKQIKESFALLASVCIKISSSASDLCKE